MEPGVTMSSVLQHAVKGALLSIAIYFSFLGLLIVPALQRHAIFLHGVTMTWFQDVNVPEQWGFLRNQVTPFTLSTPDGEKLHAWHILPAEVYRRHEDELLQAPAGLAPSIQDRLSFKLLRDDPDSLLVLYLHGAAGTLASGYRPPSYRAIYANAPSRIHTVAIDYRGFGSSTGTPSEQGLLTDAVALTRWAMDEAGIPSSRIVIFSQSVGTGVAISLVQHLATLPEPVYLRGLVLVAPFANVKLLTETYSIAGVVPLLGPLARFPPLLSLFHRLLWTEFPSHTKLARFISHCESSKDPKARYDISLLHGKDDWDIPWTHSEVLYEHATEAISSSGAKADDLERNRDLSGDGVWAMQRRTSKGIIRKEIAKYGLHDLIMSYPIVGLAVIRAFQSGAGSL